MSPGPIRRLTGAIGLVALTPTAAMLAMNAITPVDAALRAVATVLAVSVVGRLVSLWVSAVAGSLEKEAAADQPAAPSAGQTPRRRRTDLQEQAG